MLKALIFDFDGLILDTEYPEYLSWQQIYSDYDLELPIAEWAAGIGKGSESLTLTQYDLLERQLGRGVDRAAVRERRHRRFERMMDSQTVLPGIVPLLEEARSRDIRIAIASSSPRRWVTHYITKLRIQDSFDIIRCGDDVRNPKPDPEVYLSALHCVECSAAEAVALEDSAIGIASAKAAGLTCIAISNRLTVHSHLHDADMVTSTAKNLCLDDIARLVGGFSQVPNP